MYNTEAQIPTLRGADRRAGRDAVRPSSACRRVASRRSSADRLHGFRPRPAEIAIGLPADLPAPPARRAPEPSGCSPRRARRSASRKADLLPHLSLVGSISLRREGRREVLRRAELRGRSAGPTFSWAILNYGRITRQRARAGRRVPGARQRLHDRRAAGRRRGRERAVATIAGRIQRTESLRQSVTAAQKVVDLDRTASTARAPSTSRRCCSRSSSSSTAGERCYVASRGEAAATLVVTLYKSLGGGWEPWQGRSVVSDRDREADDAIGTRWGDLARRARATEASQQAAADGHRGRTAAGGAGAGGGQSGEPATTSRDRRPRRPRCRRRRLRRRHEARRARRRRRSPISQPVEEPVQETLEFTGRTSAIESVEVRARVTGYITKVAFTDGATGEGRRPPVRDRSARVPTPAVLRAEGDVARLRAQLARADAGGRAEPGACGRPAPRARGSWRRRSPSRDPPRASSRRSSAELERRDASTVEFTRVTAPISGRASSRRDHAGQPGRRRRLGRPAAHDDRQRRSDLRRLRCRRAGAAPPPEGDGRAGRRGDRPKPCANAKTPVPIGARRRGGLPAPGHHRLSSTTRSTRRPGRSASARELAECRRGCFAPGFFVRVRVPVGEPKPGLLVTDRAIGTDQDRKYVLVVNDKNVVEYRPVKLGSIHERPPLGHRGLTARRLDRS